MQVFTRLVVASVIGSVVLTNLAGCGGKPKQKNPTAANTEAASESEIKPSSWEENAEIRAAIDSKDFTSARAMAMARISESPRDARAHFLLGQAYFGENNLAKSRKSFEAAVELAPNDRNYQRELNGCLAAIADSALDKDLPSEAIDIFKRLLNDNYQPGQTEIKLADVYGKTSDKLIETGNTSEAESLLREAINVVPDRPEIRTKLAKLLIDGDRLMESERILRALRETHPENEDGLVLYASLLHRMGEISQAGEILQKILKLAPGNPQALALRASIHSDVPMIVVEHSTQTPTDIAGIKEKLTMYKKTGNLLEQKKLRGILISLQPDEYQNLLELSIVCEKLGQTDEALENAQKYLQMAPDSLPGKLQLARCLYQKGEAQQALTIIEEIESVYPDRLEILNEKGQATARMGNFPQARLLWDQVLELDPEHVSTLFNYGQLEMESGKNYEAQAYFEKAIRKEPFNHKFRYFAGLNLIQSGLKEQAHSLWQASKNTLNSDDPYADRILRALGKERHETRTDLGAPPPSLALQIEEHLPHVPAHVINESAPDSNYDRALEYARGGLFNEAIHSFKAVLERDPNHFNALMNLGKVYTAMSNHNHACALYLKALKLDPSNIFAQRGLANAYSEVGMHTLAAQISDQVRVSSPDKLEGFPRYSQSNLRNNPRSFEPLAHAMISEGLLTEASAVVQTGMSQQPDSASLFLLQGDIHKHTGQFEQAMQAYQTALDKDMQSPAPLIRIGDLYLHAQQFTSAAEEYQKALKAGFIDPDSMFLIADRFSQIGREADARRVLGRLKGMNLNQAQLMKLDQRLGTSLANQEEESL